MAKSLGANLVNAANRYPDLSAENKQDRYDPAEREKQLQEAAERKRKQEIAAQRTKMQAELETAIQTKDKMINLANQAASEAGQLANTISEAIAALTAATNNSHVGTSQFCTAASSALASAKIIQTQLSNAANGAGLIASIQSVASQTVNNVFSSTGSSGGGGGGGGSASATMIHVAPEIAGARSDIASAAEELGQACSSLILLMGIVKTQSKDLETAAGRMADFSTRLTKLRAQMSKMASDITTTYNAYHTAQEEAIYRAAMIPH